MASNFRCDSPMQSFSYLLQCKRGNRRKDLYLEICQEYRRVLQLREGLGTACQVGNDLGWASSVCPISESPTVLFSTNVSGIS